MGMPAVGDILALTQVIDEHIYRLGREESERRLGRPIDADFLTSLYAVDEQGVVTPTALYQEALDKLGAESSK